MRYGARLPPIDPKELPQFLAEELPRIQNAINAIYDGIYENTIEEPGGDDPLLYYTDGSYDPGGGEGWYVRHGNSHYKITLVPVQIELHPTVGVVSVEGQVPTVS